MLRKIDILPLQVLIEAVIAEVTLNDNLQYGTQFFFKSHGVNIILNNSTCDTDRDRSSRRRHLDGSFLGSSAAATDRAERRSSSRRCRR